MLSEILLLFCKLDALLFYVGMCLTLVYMLLMEPFLGSLVQVLESYNHICEVELT